MSLWDRLKAELIDIVEWLDPTSDTMVHRFDQRPNNEIKHGAKLIVREGQAAVFIDQGKIADVFGPGIYTLDTKNLPILATIKGWKYGFESPFKAEVYFVSTRQFTDLKWGTMNPLMLRDAEFGPIRLRAFGTYVTRVSDPGLFVREIVGTDGTFTADEITGQLRNVIVSRFADILGESKIPALDLAANYDELGKFLTGRIGDEFRAKGLELVKLLVENISLPPQVEEALDKRSSMGVIGNLSAYTQFSAAEAMTKAASNPGGDAAAGIGMGMGFAMAQQMGQAMAGAQAPPPLPGAGAGAAWYVAIDGARSGPMSESALREMCAGGKLPGTALVWKAGMAEWKRCGDVPEVAAMLSSVPPPLPPR
ncbi:MAG: SPFH domain-containing protein [Planctomycetota bacterium]|nr:SPFH domain-containing protein [Planctomycetota bacterium]